MTLIVAHRGASRAEPENSIAAFRRAGGMGADGVELDVRRTLDDQLVVHHDPVLADGRIVRRTVAADLPGPLLADALDACAGMFVNVEIKNDESEPDFDPDEWVAGQVAVELMRRRTNLRWVVSSFRLATIDAMRSIEPTIRTAWLTEQLDAATVAAVCAGDHLGVHPSVESLDQGAIRLAHAAGVFVVAWTCDEPERLRELIGWGIDGICTNVPDVALAIRAGVTSG
ncbi:MAG: glycerophosphodiester phosphodiesterase [Ilumatobacteraceae bacterium]